MNPAKRKKLYRASLADVKNNSSAAVSVQPAVVQAESKKQLDLGLKQMPAAETVELPKQEVVSVATSVAVAALTVDQTVVTEPTSTEETVTTVESDVMHPVMEVKKKKKI
jgi:hypothetical protein